MIKMKALAIFLIILILSCLISSAAIGYILAETYAEDQYRILSGITEGILLKYPESEQEIFRLIKEAVLTRREAAGKSRLQVYGYSQNTFAYGYMVKMIPYILLITPLFFFLLLLLILLIRRKYRQRIKGLTGYLEQVNRDNGNSVLSRKEDDFSMLEDEIYKTVTQLRQMKETAERERKSLADNLADISHQIKTPVAAVSLMTQLLEEEGSSSYAERIRRHLKHLEQLVEALLTLSRIDAGTLQLSKSQVDIYTMLQLSLDSLDTAIQQKQIRVILPNHPEVTYTGDLEWSMEAFINIIKDCIEHIPYGGIIKADYERNPLYTQIRIEDNGPGFPDKDLPHIFERFYRGENTSGTGAGIGLSLSKAIIELQNGIIHSGNLQNGGAVFIVRFYSH